MHAPVSLTIENLQIIDSFDINSTHSERFLKAKDKMNPTKCLTDRDNVKEGNEEQPSLKAQQKKMNKNHIIKPILVNRKKQ